ncbi:peptidoglycan-binding protein [Fructobacillus cardui]|uniref:aggregation-promoting factor C-terminal-like domain-containing protein n=1 Tax=Fructobacillus cardui TaxID=2893170 RepID=UPI00200A2E4A|nr:peptidoglycan-binding protein [Fructobacillus cardui]MCK8627691.1 peptidoglycan-binding protein [Fructobacillus cardui]CAK1243057.1 LysM repeat (LysM) [Fructobacillus cardui]
MMFNKVLLTSMAVAGLALTAANTQFNKGKSTSDQAVKVTDSVNTKKVSTAVSSVDNLKSLENTAASQTVASSDDDTASSSDDTSNSQSQVTSLSATTTQAAQATPVATSTAAQASSTSTAAASTSSASTATTSAAATTSTASGDINWLISRESGGNVNAQNGQFYGIGQLSPAAYATYVPGQNYQGNYAVQLQAMQAYIAARYGSVANAISHFQSNGWY